jgi:hypothetical protein
VAGRLACLTRCYEQLTTSCPQLVYKFVLVFLIQWGKSNGIFIPKYRSLVCGRLRLRLRLTLTLTLTLKLEAWLVKLACYIFQANLALT